MQGIKKSFKDRDLEYIIGTLLRWGVFISMIVTFIGGMIYLYRHGQEQVSYGVYTESHRNVTSIVSDVWQGIMDNRGRAIILLGIMLLFATPITRVLFSLVGFIVEKDWLYVSITLIVLLIIFISVRGGLGG